MVKSTSVQTYMELNNSGQLSKQQSKVLQAVINMPYLPTRNEVKQEQLSDWEKSTISGRINELLDKGFLQVSGKRDDSFSGRKSETLQVVNPEPETVQDNEKNEELEAGDVIFGGHRFASTNSISGRSIDAVAAVKHSTLRKK